MRQMPYADEGLIKTRTYAEEETEGTGTVSFQSCSH